VQHLRIAHDKGDKEEQKTVASLHQLGLPFEEEKQEEEQEEVSLNRRFSIVWKIVWLDSRKPRRECCTRRSA